MISTSIQLLALLQRNIQRSEGIKENDAPTIIDYSEFNHLVPSPSHSYFSSRLITMASEQAVSIRAVDCTTCKAKGKVNCGVCHNLHEGYLREPCQGCINQNNVPIPERVCTRCADPESGRATGVTWTFCTNKDCYNGKVPCEDCDGDGFLEVRFQRIQL
jgi:hypothetical protein